MDIERTLAILTSLADGRDPSSHAVLPPSHLCQQPDVIRALHAARDLAGREARLQRARQRARLTMPRNVGRGWSSDEERALAVRFRAGTDLVELARVHGRTVSGIRLRLEKLGLAPGPGPGREPVLARREAGPTDGAAHASQPVSRTTAGPLQ